MDKKTDLILGVVCAIAFFPVMGQAATSTSNTASRAVSTASTASAASATKQSEAFKALVSQRKAATQTFGQKASGGWRSDVVSKTEAASAAKKVSSAKVPEKAAEKVLMVEYSKKGTITGVSPQGFALEYAVDKKAGGMEIWFNYGEGMEFSGMRGKSELREGDMVNVVYDQAPNNSKVVKEIALLRKKPKESEAN